MTFDLSVKIENRAKLFTILENTCTQEIYKSSDKLHKLVNRYYNKFLENEIDQKYSDKKTLPIRKKKMTSPSIFVFFPVHFIASAAAYLTCS